MKVIIASLFISLSLVSGAQAIASIFQGAQSLHTCTAETRCINEQDRIELDLDESEVEELVAEGWKKG